MYPFMGNWWTWYNTFAPSIPVPDLYWNVRGPEQRILYIWKNIGAIFEYLDSMGHKVESIETMMQQILDGHLDPMIEAAIEAWFEENEPQIVQDIADLKAEDIALNGRIDTVEDSIDLIKARHLANVEFDVAARLVLLQDSYPGKAYQSGCVFEQDGNRFAATWLASDEVGVDYLLIIDIDANQLMGIVNTVDMGHGHNLTYNPLTKELAGCANDAIYFFDVSDVNAPFMAHSNATPDIEGYGHPYYIAYDDTDYNHFWVLKNDYDRNDYQLLYTSTAFDLIKVVELEANDSHQPSHQGMDVKNGICYLSLSGPEVVVMLDVETGERLNTVNVPSFIKFLPIREIEWCGVIGTTLYISQANYYPDHIAPVIFAYDMLHGTVGIKDDYFRMSTNAEDNIGQYLHVAYEHANPRNPYSISSQRPRFTFVEDAINYAKHYNIPTRLTFDDDYPFFANISDFDFELNPQTQVKIGGLCFINCTVRFNAVSRLTFTGLGSSVIHSNTYAHAIKMINCQLAVYSLWSVDLDETIDLTPSNGYFAECFIAAGQVSDWGVAAFQSCMIVAKSGSHANVINQAGTTWTV